MGRPMFVEGGWRPRREPPPGAPRPTDREERMLLWLVAAIALLLLLAPIGGATILQAVVATLKLG
jgi:hypothetical protein